jgi:hypothetical protein
MDPQTRPARHAPAVSDFRCEFKRIIIVGALHNILAALR